MRVLSLGWGLQSFAIAAMAALGELEPLDAAIFADTGHEREGTYAFAARWAPWLEERGVRVVTVAAADRSVVRRWASSVGAMVPAFVDDGGMVRRQCTGEWKIEPIKRWVRANGGAKGCEQLMGITVDEVTRCKPSGVGYITHRWPLVELGMSRDGVRVWLERRGLPVPPRSACVFCPFQSGVEWRSLAAGDFARAVEADEAIRDVPRRGRLFVHRSRVPLREVGARFSDQPELWDNECSGFCHS